MKKTFCILLGVLSFAIMGRAQSGEAALHKEANTLFEDGEFAQAMPLYSQLVSLHPSDHDLNYKLGTCIIHSGESKESAIGFLKYALENEEVSKEAWFYLGRAQQLTYRFKEALSSYDKFKSGAGKKELAEHNVIQAQAQCQNGLKLLSNIKEVQVLNKVEVDIQDFFRFYDLEDIGGKIVVTPDELKSAYDKKKGLRSLVYLPAQGGPIYFASYGKDGSTGKDIYRSELRPDGKFLPPVKLPSNVNSSADEDHAFMHPDSKTFYFSSKGHSSMGGYDVFKCEYDRSRDFFGMAENMDFAVNTPDDDILYLVDPSGAEACFASTRQSAQGDIHVYRVRTEQIPLTLTILKGVFNSEIDPSETDARIVVEDALSHEIVGEYNTEADGSYIISMPRSGKYKFIITPSASGNTHMGLVELPRSENSNAYGQELTLVEQGTQEKLIIKNFFDEPLQEDLLALAQEEIRRRALLDINGSNEDQGEALATIADPLREAGFGPDVTVEDVIAIANTESAKASEELNDLGIIKEQAYGVAEEQTEAAQKFKDEAAEIAVKAKRGDGSVDENLMADAAMLQVRSERAKERARAAEKLGVELDKEHELVGSGVLEIGALSNDLKEEGVESESGELVAMLTSLKNRVDGRTGNAEKSIDLKERIRRNATELQKKAGKQLERMLDSSEEENSLVNRINRLKSEQANLKGKKKAQKQAEIERQENELIAIQEETQSYLAKAESIERDAATARHKVELMDLLTSGRSIDVPVLNEARKQQLPDEIAQVEKEIEALPIEERFREEAEVRFSDVADTELTVTAVLPDSFEVPDATVGDANTTESFQSQETENIRTEVMGTDDVAFLEESARMTETSSEEEGVSVRNTAGSADVEAVSAVEFERANRITELTQLRSATEDITEIAKIDEELNTLRTESVEKQTVYTRILSGYEPDMSDQDLEKIIGLYVFDKEGVALSSEEKFKIERRKVQVVEQKIAEQNAELQKAPVDLVQRQALVERLQVIKADHEIQASRFEQEMRNSVVDLQPFEDPDDLTVNTNELLIKSSSAQVTSAIETYIKIDPEPTKVFESNVTFRSNEVDESKSLFDQHILNVQTLNEEIDSLRLLLQDLESDKAYDRVTKSVDKKIDDILIERTALGMRSEFLAKQERRHLLDSLKSVTDESGTEPGRERAMTMIADFESSSKASFDNAKRIRKQADRTSDIVEKDQLFRQAYKEELLGLQDIGHAITVHKYVQSDFFVPGTGNSIHEMEEALFPRTVTAPVEEVIVERVENIDISEPVQVEEAPIATATVTPIEDDRPVELTRVDERITDQKALEDIALYESIASSKANEAKKRSAESEDLLAKAQMLEDSAATLRKKKAAALLSEAELLRKQGETSAQMAVELEKEATIAQFSSQQVIERQSTMRNFGRFYMLDQDDLYVVEEDEEYYKYLQARSNALALIEEAIERELESEAKRMLADLYLNEAREILAGAQASNENPDPETMSKAGDLNDLAAMLLAQSDSLQRVADRLKSKASLNNALADELLTQLSQEKANGILGFEARIILAEPNVEELVADDTQDVELPVIAPGTAFNDTEDPVAVRDTVVNETGESENELVTATLPTGLNESTVEADPLEEAIALMPGQAEGTEIVEDDNSEVTEVTPTNTTGMLMADVFYMSDEPVKNRTIPMNVDMPKGVVFKVQIGAFSERIPSDLYGDLDPVTGEQIGNGLVRYSAGLFMTYDNAADAKKQVRNRGYEDAFVVAYIDGKRVSLAAAKEKLGIDRPELVSAPVVAAATPTTTRRPVQQQREVSDPQPEIVDIPEYDMSELDTDYGDAPNAAPADKVETIKGLFFTVQVGVYSKPVALDKLYNITPLNTELIRDGMIRYTTGRYSGVTTASGRKDETRIAGVKDAFVTAYMNGKRISLSEAKTLLELHGNAVLAK